jgi:hypothetical protein
MPRLYAECGAAGVTSSATGGEAVRGRPGRRRDDDRVGRVADELVPGDADRDHRAAVARHPHHGHVVERGDRPAGENGVHGQPGLDGEPVAVDGRERFGEVRHVHLGQEAELAQVHAEHRGAVPVGQPHRAQHGPVPAEADQQVGPAGELRRGHRDRRAVQPGDLLGDAEDLDPAFRRPAEDRGDGRGRVTLRMQHQTGGVHGPCLPASARHRDIDTAFAAGRVG